MLPHVTSRDHLKRAMDNNLLYSRQSGFRRMYSTETALIKLVDELLFGLDNNHVCGMVLVDYRKAFDMVDHKLLLRKLELAQQYGKYGKYFDEQNTLP